MKRTCVSILAVLCFAGATFAQGLVLTIKDGTVVLNGKEIPPDELPEGLDVSGVTVSLSAEPAGARTLVELNGDFYGLRDGRLVALEETGLGVMPTLRFEFGDPLHRSAEDMAASLFQQATYLKAVRTDSEVRAVITKAEESITEAARIMEMVPTLHVQSYLSAVQRQDEELFQSLLEESRMEFEAARLAAVIRRATDGAEQERRTEELRRQLNVIFDFKQHNRRSEIRQLETEIAALHSRMERREAARGRLVDARLRELIGQ